MLRGESFPGSNFKCDLPTRLQRKIKMRAATDAHWRKVCREVDARDGYRCRACGCRVVNTISVQPNRLERHHILLRSQGGENTTANVCVLCLQCHEDRHFQKLTITGNADKTLRIKERDGKVRKSPAPRVRP